MQRTRVPPVPTHRRRRGTVADVFENPSHDRANGYFIIDNENSGRVRLCKLGDHNHLASGG